MQNKLETFANSVKINSKEYPKNTLCIEEGEKEEIFVKTVSENNTIASGVAKQWKNGSNVPYANKAALITDLRAALFA